LGNSTNAHQEFKDPIEALNRVELERATSRFEDREPPLESTLLVGWPEIASLIIKLVNQNCQKKKVPVSTIALDGYLGIDWQQVIQIVEQVCVQSEISSRFIDIENCLKDEAEISEQLKPYLGSDPVFGRIYKKKRLKSLFNLRKLKNLKAEVRKLRSEYRTAGKLSPKPKPLLILVYGTGATLTPLRSIYDSVFYADLTREELLKRSKQWRDLAGKTQSISPKKLYYVDFPINDQHRNQLLQLMDYYIDANINHQPVLVSRTTLQKLTGILASQPFQLKPMYEPGPWGGQWLRKIRQLPKDWPNCAWSFEVIAPEMSLLVKLGPSVLEIPWSTFYHLEYDRIMGKVSKKRFAGQFPIRFDYLDTMDGGDLSIQVHPPTSYIQKEFGEPYHQGEMYYIVDAKPGATVNLGVREDCSAEDFFKRLN